MKAHSLRMTCCRLVPETATRARGGKRPSLRLLPTEVVVIVLDPAEEDQYQNRSWLTIKLGLCVSDWVHV